MQRLLFVFALTAATSAIAQNWTLLTSGGSGGGEYSIYIDTSTLRPQGQYIKAWVMNAYKEPQQSSNGAYKTKSNLLYANCRDGTFALKQSIAYADQGGSTVSSEVFPESSLQFSDPAPGTVGAVIVRRMCAKH